MLTQGVTSAVTGGVTSAIGSASASGASSAAGNTGAATAAQSVTLGDAAMSIATSEAIAATQQAVLMATGLQSKPDWKGFAVAAFNGAAGTSVKANLGDGMIASNTYTGLTVTGDMLIRGEHVNADVLTATMAGSMVGNYAGQKGLE